MISDKLGYRAAEKDLDKTFPLLSNSLTLVIDADTPEQAREAQKLLAAACAAKKDLFKIVYIPGGGAFFEKNGLLYLDVPELESLTDSLAQAQPFIALLSHEVSLAGFFSVLQKALSRTDTNTENNTGFVMLCSRLSDALENTMQGKRWSLSWQELMTGRKIEHDQLRQFVAVYPELDYHELYPAEKAIDAVRAIVAALGLTEEHGVKVRITGSLAINHDDLKSIDNGIIVSFLIAFLSLSIVMYIGVRSLRMTCAGLVTLVVGLVWTMWFGIAAIGSLNLISITFAVMFIGIGIDYSIVFCLRYREALEAGADIRSALAAAQAGVCNALLLCTIAIAIGFYAFVPTDYAGASELGIISGTGMFFNLFTNLTFLPALLNIMPKGTKRLQPIALNKRLTVLSEKHAWKVAAGSLILAAGIATVLPKISFDFNPLNLSNPAADSVILAKELFADEKTTPWTISIIAENFHKAHKLADELKKLKEVGMAITIADFVPDDQKDKLALIADMALFMPPLPPDLHPVHGTYEQNAAALKNLETALRNSPALVSGKQSDYSAAVRRLYDSAKRFYAFIEKSQQGPAAFSVLENGLLPNLAELLISLGASLHPQAVTVADLPWEQRDRFVAPDGRCRIEVYPRENITNLAMLGKFVSGVRAVAPEATDMPVTMLEAGKAIVSSFRDATVYALVAITVFLLVVLGNPFEVLLILIPLLLGVIYAAGTAVLIGIPFNFANIIALPLLLGSGLEYGINLICRVRHDSSSDQHVLLTSTSRAVLFCALTTIVSFVSLALLPHQGTASMGKLFALCFSFIILSNLVIFPAYLKIYRDLAQRRGHGAGQRLP